MSGFGDVFVCVLLFLLKCSCFISFILLFARYNNEKIKKAVRITLGSTYICTAIYFIINGLIFLFSRVLSQYQYIGDMISVSNVILWILGGVIWPIFVLIVGGLVLGYILFSEKYIKIENQFNVRFLLIKKRTIQCFVEWSLCWFYYIFL